jgi:YhgE/Pip-like protein
VQILRVEIIKGGFNLKKIFDIYKKDIHDIFSNSSLLIIILGLCVLPSLYAWFNIKASWDPYSNTQNISIAVVNNDQGNNILNKEINIGDKLVTTLKENNALGWEFVDSLTATEGLKNATYYATIEIPKDFSKDLSSLLTSDIKKGEIIYTVNEKINAIAPKITDKGASSIQLQINETVVETVSKVLFEVFNEVGINLEDNLPKLKKIETSLIEVQEKFKNVNEAVDLGVEATDKIGGILNDINVDLIKSTLTDTIDLSNDVETFLTEAKNNIDKISPVIKTDLKLLVDTSSNLSNTITQINESTPEVVSNLKVKLTSISNTLETLLTFLKNLNKNNQLTESINQLEDSLTNINLALSLLDETSLKDNLNKILTISNDVNLIATNLSDNFDVKISEPINKIFNQSINASSDILKILQNAQNKLPDAIDILETSLDFFDKSNDSLEFVKEKMPKANEILDELVSAVTKINSSDEIDELVTLLKNDIVGESEFLKEPVEIIDKKIYPIKNYGSAMTPFYTVLSLWVGILLLVSIISTNIHGDFSPTEIYFGRGLTFVSLTIIQAFIVSIGDIFLLKVQMENPVLFVLICIFTSVVFTFIVYSLVSVFANIGKAIAIILMVLQVAGSGGTFPIEVTPRFFQILNPFLPFTHAIVALRETIGGIYAPNLTKSLIILLIFLIVSILINAILKSPINKLLHGFSDKFNSSDLIGH